MGLDSIQPPKPFQAEYEGSIPFTRSKRFSGLDAITEARVTRGIGARQ
jgi:hypothetical protein